MLTNYSFSWWAGEDQKLLVATLILGSLQSCINSYLTYTAYRHLYTLTIQQGVILTMPFLVPSWHTLSYYVYHTMLHIQYTTILLVVTYFQLPEKRESIYSGIVALGYIHLFVMWLVYFQELNNRPAYLAHRDPFEPYAISREILHTDLITKPPPDTRERNKARSRGASRRA